MDEKKRLNKEELEKVTGGSYFPDEYQKYRSTYTIFVDKYAGEIGKYYFFRNESNTSPDWLFGELRNSYEHNAVFGTIRTHDVYVVDGSPLTTGNGSYLSKYGTMELNGNVYRMYTKAGD